MTKLNEKGKATKGYQKARKAANKKAANSRAINRRR